MASKTLVLSESVRDASDLYLSVKYKPIVLINDSPCGFVRHLEIREPQLTKKLWGDYSGCFEKPDYAKTILTVRKAKLTMNIKKVRIVITFHEIYSDNKNSEHYKVFLTFSEKKKCFFLILIND